jgi:hypothetical protein
MMQDKKDMKKKTEADVNDPTQKHSESDTPVNENNKAGIPPSPLFGQQGEEYLRESANIEDMPDKKDDDDYDKTIEEESDH